MAKPGTVGASSGGALNRFTFLLLLCLALIQILVAAALYLFEQQEQRQHDIAQIQGVAEGLSARLSNGLKFHSQVLLQFVRNSHLGKQLLAEEWKEVKRQEMQLMRLLPQVLKARFLPVEWDQLEPDSKPPISYATLELLRLIERTGKPSVAEVHQPGLAQPHVALAVPILVRSSGELAGVAHLALPIKVLSREMEDIIRTSGGRIELQQVVDGGAVTLAAVGADSMSDPMDGEITVPGTIWRLAYWGGSSGAGMSSEVTPLGVLALGLALSGLVVILLLVQFRGSLRTDRAAILALTRDLLQGKGARPPPRARIAELQGVLDLLALQGSTGKGKPAESEEIPEKPPVLEPPVVQQVAPASAPQPVSAAPVPESIFRAYDIRGVVDETLTPDGVYQIGRAIGSAAEQAGEQTVLIARDGRNSSDALSEALGRGLMDSGREVVDLGLVPTPMLYFATHFLGSSSGVMVTGSHNPPEYNGLKVVIAGEALSAERIKDLYRRIAEGDLVTGEGHLREQDLVPDYIGRISEDVQLLAPMKVVIDCGNGVASVVAPSLFRVLGCDVIDLYCEVNGDFPNHHPDPSDPRNMQTLIYRVKEHGADLGVAFDGDGDRLGVVDSQGKIIWPDRLLMLLARDVLLRQPGVDVIYDVKSSRHLAGEILAYGGRPIMWKSGHSLVKAKLKETGALLAGELSGHIYFQDRWYGFDDGLYSCARLLEILSAEGISTSEVFAQLPESMATPEIYVATGEGENFALVSALTEQARFPGAKLITIDGIRAEFEDGWGLVRPSNTSPSIVLRFEADSEAALARIQGLFREQIEAIAPTLELPF